MSNSYGDFSGVYDILTSEIDYAVRGEYFHKLNRLHGGREGILLDLGCGTGTMCEVMADLGYDCIGVDGSEEMLSSAMEKRMESGHDITYLCQDMTELDLFGTIDCAVSALDSLNHLTSYEDLCKAIDRVALFLYPGGLFIFDMNTVYKHDVVLGNNTFIYDFDDVFCAWQNTLLEDHTVQMDLNIFGTEDGETYDRLEDSFCERAYTPSEIEEALSAAGLQIVAVYEGDTLFPPTETTQRVVYVTKHRDEKGRQRI